MAVKRRTLWLSDEAWDAAERQAQPFEMSRSAYISSLIIGGRVIPHGLVAEFLGGDGLDIDTGKVTPMTQAERDAILRRVNKG